LFIPFSRKQVPVGKVKVKGISLQVWISPEGSRKLRLPDFKKIGT
jgi:hypothetical protein